MSGLSQLAIGSAVSYVVAVLLPALDAVILLLPAETAVIALGVTTAGSADPRIAVLVALAALGAFLGDNAAYLLGRRFGPVIGTRLFAGERGARRRAWAQHSLDRFGARLIIVCRFVPGGRTAVTITCGLVGYPRRSFIPATAAAGIIWASYALFIGRLGGNAFETRPWAGLLLALGLALIISILIDAARRAWHWRQTRRNPSRPPGPGDGTASTPAGHGDPASGHPGQTIAPAADGDHPRPHPGGPRPDHGHGGRPYRRQPTTGGLPMPGTPPDPHVGTDQRCRRRPARAGGP